QTLTGRAHEGLTSTVLFATRRLPDEHDVRVRIANPEHQVPPRPGQRTACAITHNLLAQVVEFPSWCPLQRLLPNLLPALSLDVRDCFARPRGCRLRTHLELSRRRHRDRKAPPRNVA